MRYVIIFVGLFFACKIIKEATGQKIHTVSVRPHFGIYTSRSVSLCLWLCLCRPLRNPKFQAEGFHTRARSNAY